MTCIVATAAFVMADRRVLADEQISSMRKVAKNRHLIAATAGNAASALAVVQAVRAGAQAPEELLSHVDKSSHALVLTALGQLWMLSDGGIWALDVRRPHAVGSGADLALGFLAGRGRVDPATARQALAFAAERRADCGGGADLRHF